MERLIRWLERHRAVALLSSAAFYLAVVVFHDEVTRVAIRVRNDMGVEGYNLLFTIISATLLGLFLAYALDRLRKGAYKATRSAFLLATVLLVFLFFRFALVYNIEAVHFGQYMVMAILLFPVIRGYGETVFWVTVLGVIDELYQYTILTPFFKYFDFNDIILNLLGAGLGVVLIFISTDCSPGRPIRWKMPSLLFSVALALLLMILSLAGEFRVDPGTVTGGKDPFITLNRTSIPGGFWAKAYEGRYYHVVRPGAGVVLIYGLFIFYFLIDLFTIKRMK